MHSEIPNELERLARAMATELNALPNPQEPVQGVSAESARRVIDQFKRQLVATPVASMPIEHGSLAYRLGLAFSEFPSGDPHANARQALSCFEVAAKLFNPEEYPVLHARVINAAGISLRVLGNTEGAAHMFENAAALLEGKEESQERAASLNNLGLARMEQGEPLGAIAAFGWALYALDDITTKPWVRASMIYNRGLAYCALGTRAGYENAAKDFQVVLEIIDRTEAMNLYGLAWHSMGVVETSLAFLSEDGDSRRHYFNGIEAFNEALGVFVRGEFPYQYALILHNKSVAQFGLGDTQNLLKALVNLEKALNVFDPRLHSDSWKRSYELISKVEAELNERFPGLTRDDHFAALVAASPEFEAKVLLQERFEHIFSLPELARRKVLLGITSAVVRLGPKLMQIVMEREIKVLMDFPPARLEELLLAQLDTHSRLSQKAEEDANRVLDSSVGNALNTPQRVFVRDFLYSVGFSRP